MYRKFFLVLTFALLLADLIFASHENAKYQLGDNDEEICISGCIDYNQNNPSSFDWQHGKLNTVPPDKLDFIQIRQFGRENELTADQLSYRDSSGTPNMNRIKDWSKLDKAARDEALAEITKKPTSTENPVGGEVIGESVKFDSIGFWKIGETSVNNCISCIYDGKKLKFKHADSVVTNKSATTNIDDFEGFADIFRVEKADSLLSGCLRFDNIKESSFSVFDGKVEADVRNGNNITITDCSYTQSEFESKGNGSITSTKDAKPKYEIREGTLKCRYGKNTDRIDAENSASVEMDNCFSCMTITPPGTYFYSDTDIRKDFSVNVPKESSSYRLCLRKNAAQQFGEYNGLVDFVSERIELNGIVSYLRYPLRNGQLSALLSGFVYKGLKDVKTVFSYDNGMIFLSNVNIQNTIKNKNRITITRPNNFYAIEEIELDGKIHRVVSLSLLKKEDITQSIISNYESDSLDADVKIENGVLIQQAGESKVVIFPPGHQDINIFLR